MVELAIWLVSAYIVLTVGAYVVLGIIVLAWKIFEAVAYLVWSICVAPVYIIEGLLVAARWVRQQARLVGPWLRLTRPSRSQS